MMRALPSWRQIAGIATLSVVVATLPGIAITNASWIDQEYDVASLNTLQCAGNTDLSSRATSRFLYGTVGSGPDNSLDTLAGVTGIVVTNTGTTQSAIAGSPGAVVAGSGYAAPLSASAINGVVQTGTNVSLPLTWPVGTYQQYGRALDTGFSNSAAGAVSNAGAIDTGAPGLSPGVGTLSLSTLPGIGTTLGTLTDVALSVGAVGSTASLDGCAFAWTGGTPTGAQLQRNYLVSSLTATATSPTVAALFNTTGSITNLVQADLNTEFGTNVTSGEAETAISAAGIGALTTAVSTGLLSPLLGPVNSALGLLGVSLSVNDASALKAASTVVTVNAAPVTALLSSTISDGVVTVNLANGAIGFDVGALSGGLNNRPANTELLTDAEVADVTARVNTLLTAQIAAIRTALTTALETATVAVSLTVAIRAGANDVMQVQVGYAGTLRQFVDGTAATPLVTVSGPTITIIGSGPVQNALISTGAVGILGTVLGTVSSVTTTVLDTAQSQAFDELLGTQLESILTSARALEASALGVLSPLMTALGGLLTLTINAQPDQPGGGAVPSSSAQTGEFFVSALRLSAVNGANSLLNLWLATSSVGANTT